MKRGLQRPYVALMPRMTRKMSVCQRFVRTRRKKSPRETFRRVVVRI
jgi:hypothetical protein